MRTSIKGSLLWRLGFVLSLIAAMALLGILSSVLIAERLRGAATAINHAGTLRYSTYDASTTVLRPQVEDREAHRLALDVALLRFERHYASEALSRMVPVAVRHPARVAYDDIGHRWVAEVRPTLIEALERPPDAASYQAIRAQVDDFVSRVDRMVGLLEQRAEAQVQLLRVVQGGGLLLTLLVIVFTGRFLRREVMRPLRELLVGAQGMRRGDFSRRIGHTGADELGQLGVAFNLMAQDLARSYDELEHRVQDKTRALASSNRSLELMYRALSHLHDGTLSRGNYTQTLREMERVLGLGRIRLCLLEADGRKGYQLADSHHDREVSGPLCEQHTCSDCLKPIWVAEPSVPAPDHGPSLSIPLYDDGKIHALLQMDVPPEVTPEPWQLQLIEAIARHLGVAIASQRRVIESRRLALWEERAAITRDLHDSLAQALSYLKIQVTRLDRAMHGTEANLPGERGAKPRGRSAKDEVAAALQELRDGLNDAYQQLRELLTTFRIGIDAAGLRAALQETVAAARDRGGQVVELDNALADGELGINEEVHVLQIVREALCNVQRHAHATRSRVTLAWTADHRVRVAVVDNGRGIGAAQDRPDHYGLNIMRERTRQLHGTLAIEGLPEGGTQVQLLFRPAGVPAAPVASEPGKVLPESRALDSGPGLSAASGSGLGAR